MRYLLKGWLHLRSQMNTRSLRIRAYAPRSVVQEFCVIWSKLSWQLWQENRKIEHLIKDMTEIIVCSSSQIATMLFKLQYALVRFFKKFTCLPALRSKLYLLQKYTCKCKSPTVCLQLSL